MTKHALLAGVGMLSVCLTASAQRPAYAARDRSFGLQQPIAIPANSAAPGIFRGMDRWSGNFPALALSDRSLFSFSTGYTSAGNSTEHFLPALPAASSPRAQSTAISGGDANDKLELSRPSPYYVSGEVGFLYGISTGKHGGDFSQEYIVGEVGDEHFHITVGASHEESNLRGSRFSR